MKNNLHKYSLSAMCRVLKVSRSTYYYELKQKPDESKLNTMIIEIFKKSRNNYGTRKIKVELKKKNIIVSRRRIGRIMKEEGLVSSYAIAQFKPHHSKCNEAQTPNIVDRQFNEQEYLNVVVSDLTYVRVGTKWEYVCILIDLFNREIIGYSSGKHKDAKLVAKAFASIGTSLEKIQIFHTDRGNEFKNKLIEETLEVFNIQRSLSMKGCPYDNAVAEATFKTLKTEFIRKYKFLNSNDLQYNLADYINWFNNHRIHSSLDYLAPIEYRREHLKKTV